MRLRGYFIWRVAFNNYFAIFAKSKKHKQNIGMIQSALLSTLNDSIYTLIICLALIAIWCIIRYVMEKDITLKDIGFIIIAIFIFKIEEITFPPTIIIVAEAIFVFLCLSALATTIYSYNKIVKINDKTEEDIKNRQKLINRITVLIIIMLTAIPVIFSSWGSSLLGKYDFSKILGELDYGNFVKNGAITALFTSLLSLYADNLLHRITTPIHIYSDIKDIEKFCLYLRPFSTDNNREERRICKTLKNLFPVYAIGDPNKVLQPNGAERIYVTDKVWKKAVKEMTERSKLTVIRIGKTDGALWELSLLAQPYLINKVIFISYSLEDFELFKEKIATPLRITVKCKFPAKGALALYLDSVENEFKFYTINSGKDINEMLNDYLDSHPELDKIYTEELELRKHNFKYMFNKDRIPESVRKSLNWGIVSPIVNMRHWPIMAWIMFFAIIFISGSVFKSMVPAYIYFLALFFFGNRIEWAAGAWSSPKIFLQKQYREAKIIWGSIILGTIYSTTHIFLHIYINYL